MDIDCLMKIESLNTSALPQAILKAYKPVEFGWTIDNCEAHYYNPVFKEIYAETHNGLSEHQLQNTLLFNENIKIAINAYREGFYECFYENPVEYVTDESSQIYRIFSGIYGNSFTSIKDPAILQFKKAVHKYNLDSLEVEFEMYGREVGRFWKCWKIILNNVPLFEPIFTQHFDNDVTKKLETEKAYFKLGLLLATGEVYFEKLTDTTVLVHYEGKPMTKAQFAKKINIHHTYVNDTYNDLAVEKVDKNIYRNYRQLKNIVDYCNLHGILVDSKFMEYFHREESRVIKKKV